MHPNAVQALLFEPTGQILLVRRRNSLLWGLPGGEVRGITDPAQIADLLTIYCHRQTGVSPGFPSTFVEFTLAGKTIAVATGEVSKARAAARGRAEAVLWTTRATLPGAIEPAAKIAIALIDRITTPTTLTAEAKAPAPV